MAGEFSSSRHTPLPPTSEDRFDQLRLLRSRRVGPATFHRLMAEHGTAAEALRALPDVAAQAGVRGYQPCPPGVIHGELKAARRANARLIAIGDPDYPLLLSEADDAPPLLWAKGKLPEKPLIALVGARNASSLGVRMARSLTEGLANEGFATVSGLARGIDAAVHSASVDTGTIAVLGGGVDTVYPKENAALYDRIADQGLLLSEAPMGTQPQARHFPRRNRIIAGLCPAIVVVEAAAKSGSLLTARMALDLGRDVLAVPGHPFDARASGCNILIRDGATLVRGANDVIEVVGTPQPSQANVPLVEQPGPKRHLDLHQVILDRLGPSPLPEDALLSDLATAADDVLPVLTEMELDGQITRLPGGMLARGG